MTNKKLEVTIGIPAYNEKANIKKLLLSILSQKQTIFNLEKIIVLSDGSSDDTAARAKEIKDKRIHVIDDRKRLGKPVRENQIFSMSKSEIVVLLDADITIVSSLVLELLIEPFLKDELTMLTSGKALPLKPKTISERIFYAGTQIWENSKNSEVSNGLYLCEGEIRAFKKKLYKEIRFPKSSAEDVYPYLYCVQRNYDFEPVKNAIVFYNLPKTFQDYLKQLNRYWKSKLIHEKNFNKETVNRLYTIGFRTKVSSAIKNMIKNPVWTAIYILFLLLPKLIFVLTPKKTSGVWETSSSTKYN